MASIPRPILEPEPKTFRKIFLYSEKPKFP